MPWIFGDRLGLTVQELRPIVLTDKHPDKLVSD